MTKTFMDMVLDMQKMGHEDALAAWQEFLQAPQVQRYTRSVEAGATPHEVVYEEGTLRLLRYRNERAVELQEPVLFCFSLVNRPYILDLQADRSVVRQFVNRGFDVYLIDWGSPAAADCVLTLENYVCRFLKNVVDRVCEHAESSSLNLLGYCMGGTMSAMFTSLYQEQVRNLILLAAPIDFSGQDSLLNVWTDEKYFDVDKLVDSVGNCPGSFLQSTFQMMNPVQNFYEKYLGFFERMYDDKFLENFFAMEQWSNDNIPVAGETFREFVKMLYQRNQLIKGEFCLGQQSIDLGQIDCPLLMLTADQDRLVPPASTLAVQDFASSSTVEKMSIDAGHIGLAVSSKAHRKLWPEAVDWVAEHSTVLRGRDEM